MVKPKGEEIRLDEDELKEKVKRLFSQSLRRYYEHTLLVVENMRKLLKGIDDPEERVVLLASAYLHDIGYSEVYENDYIGNIKNQEIKIKLHSEKGAGIAKRMLNELGMSKKIIQRVAYLVSVHHREDISDPHLKLLLEADRVPA